MWLGSLLSGGGNIRNMVVGGTESTYKRAGADGSRVWSENIYQRFDSCISSSLLGQHCSSELHSEDGWISTAPVGNSEAQLELSHAKQLGNHSGVHPIRAKQGGGLALKELEGFQQMEVKSSSLPQNMPLLRSTEHGPICLKNVAPIGKIYELETGSRKSGYKCNVAELGKTIPTIFPHRTSIEEGGQGEGQHDFHNSSLAYPTLVPTTVTNFSEAALGCLQ